ncbi:MAG: hypothetical protein ACETWM_09405 [Candidatus Lokiarchaeia archaeon]
MFFKLIPLLKGIFLIAIVLPVLSSFLVLNPIYELYNMYYWLVLNGFQLYLSNDLLYWFLILNSNNAILYIYVFFVTWLALLGLGIGLVTGIYFSFRNIDSLGWEKIDTKKFFLSPNILLNPKLKRLYLIATALTCFGVSIFFLFDNTINFFFTNLMQVSLVLYLTKDLVYVFNYLSISSSLLSYPIDFSIFSVLFGLGIGLFSGIHLTLKLQSKKDQTKTKN